MKEFTFSKLSKLGEYDEKWGQAYWGDTNEQITPVKFNSMNRDITANDRIEAEEVLVKESKKGAEYHQLKKVRVVGTAGPRAPQQSQLGVTNEQLLAEIQELHSKLDKLIGEPEIADKPVSLDDIPDFN